jgi:hypothetical protein
MSNENTKPGANARIKLTVRGLTPTSRNFFGGTVESYLCRLFGLEIIDVYCFWEDSPDGKYDDNSTISMIVESKMSFEEIRSGIEASIAHTHFTRMLASIEPHHGLTVVRDVQAA